MTITEQDIQKARHLADAVAATVYQNRWDGYAQRDAANAIAAALAVEREQAGLSIPPLVLPCGCKWAIVVHPDGSIGGSGTHCKTKAALDGVET